MRYDDLRCLVREVGSWPANVGDSCAETCRAFVLGDARAFHAWERFVVEKGFVRHPSLEGHEWGEADFSNDQYAPLLMAAKLDKMRLEKPGFSIKGTRTIVSPAVFCLERGHFRTLALLNYVQGLLLKFPWRWSDSTRRFERAEGHSADFLNYAVTHAFLRRLGKWSLIPHSKEELMAKVRAYYQGGSDPEPNSEWIVELYEGAL